MDYSIKRLQADMIPVIVDSLIYRNIKRSAAYYEKCIKEQNEGIRDSFIAFYNNDVAGTVHLLTNSKYISFKENNIPEINDLFVYESFQQKGIGKKLIETCENLARSKGYSTIGLGVGLYNDYGKAQHLYCKMGYVLDGNGIMYDNKPVIPGSQVRVDDELLLYLTKKL